MQIGRNLHYCIFLNILFFLEINLDVQEVAKINVVETAQEVAVLIVLKDVAVDVPEDALTNAG